MDRKLLHMGNNSQQIASHRRTHTYRAVPLNILREGGLSFRVTTPSGIPVVALKKRMEIPSSQWKKIFRIINGAKKKSMEKYFQDYQWNILNHSQVVSLSSHWRHPHLLCWYQEYLRPVEIMYLSDEKSIADEK